MNKCACQCTSCPYIKIRKQVKMRENKFWIISKNMTCESFNIIYLLECNKCQNRYIGTTGRQLKNRLAEHRGYITNQVVSRSTGAHFNLPGHSLANLTVTILKQTRSSNAEYRKEREKYFIRKFDTFNNGINR